MNVNTEEKVRKSWTVLDKKLYIQISVIHKFAAVLNTYPEWLKEITNLFN